MTSRILTIIVGAFMACLPLRADVRELKNESGRCVQVVADFKIENQEIDSNGATRFAAKALIDGEEIGFRIVLAKASESTSWDSRKGVIPNMALNFEVRPLGLATTHLERLLNARLRLPYESKMPNVRVVGAYSSLCPYMAASVEDIMLIYGHAGMSTYDEHGAPALGECFSLKLVIDAPLERMTTYFSREGGYGGKAEANQARSQWYRSHEKSGPANQTLQRTPDTPPVSSSESDSRRR